MDVSDKNQRPADAPIQLPSSAPSVLSVSPQTPALSLTAGPLLRGNETRRREATAPHGTTSNPGAGLLEFDP